MSISGENAFLKYHTVSSAEEVFREKLSEWAGSNAQKAPFRLIDVGGGDGQKVSDFVKAIDHECVLYNLDVSSSSGDDLSICFDITLPIPDEFLGAYDIVYSFNAFEHFRDPLTAADNCAKMLRPGGVCLIHTVFSWRYHPVPNDYFRFTDDALRYMFSERNGLNTIACGYDLSMRRMDIRGGYFGDKDVPPIDDLGGFRENWAVFYVGVKPSNK